MADTGDEVEAVEAVERKNLWAEAPGGLILLIRALAEPSRRGVEGGVGLAQ